MITVKTRLQTQYKDIAERIISMALESVDYSEDKAVRILDIVITEDTKDKDKIKDKKKKSEKEKKPKEAELVEKNVSFKEARYVVLNNIFNCHIEYPTRTSLKILEKLVFKCRTN